jgi:methylation protein EvaC
MPLADAFVDPAQPADEFFFDLAIGLCGGCGTVQLCERVPDAYMFHDAYAYYSSTSAGMRRHFAAYAADVQRRLPVVKAPFVLEIGCNDGIMLESFAAAGIRHLGIDPAGNVVAEALRKGLHVQQAFFSARTAATIAAAHGRVDAIVAANVICHIADIHSVFEGVQRLLAPSGVFIFEDPYIGAILDSTAVDQIYDEHVFYFSMSAVQRIAEMHGLELIDVAPQAVHGGELRYYLAHRGAQTPSTAVADWIEREHVTGLAAPTAYRQFADRAARIRDDLHRTIVRRVASGQRIAGYGATAKSSTIINYAGLGPGEIEFIADVTPTKQGKLTPGAHIPVRPPEHFRSRYPDYAVLFAWNHEREIREKEAAFEAQGGRWITYVPAVMVGPPACSASQA